MPKTVDHATNYAERVCSGRIPACRRIHQVCSRHLDEYRSTGLPYWYDPDQARAGMAIFRAMPIPRGPLAGRPFKPFPWQAFVIGMTFGWRMHHTDSGREVRRYLDVLLQAARGAGKSPMLAGFVWQGAAADDEPDPQVHLVARKLEQGEIPWGFLKDMIRHAEGKKLLTHEYDANRREWMKRDEPLDPQFVGGREARGSKSMYLGDAASAAASLMSADATGAGATGWNSSRIVYDEYHDFRTDLLKERFETGTKGRVQPLTIGMTNAGESDQSPYGIEYKRRCLMLDGKIPDDPRTLSLFYEVDEEDDPYRVYMKGKRRVGAYKAWQKANPSLPKLPGYEYYFKEIERSKKGVAARASVDRFAFCVWTKTAKPWLARDVVEDAMAAELSPLEERMQADCFVAIDVGLNRSLTACCLLWDMGGRYEAEIACWGNEDHLLDREVILNIPFREWFEDGLMPHPVSFPEKTLVEWLIPQLKVHRVRGLTMDSEKSTQVRARLGRAGFRVVRGDIPLPYRPSTVYHWPHPQSWTGGQAEHVRGKGLWMTASIDHAQELLTARRLSVLESKAVRYGLEIASVEREGKLAKIVKEDDELPNDPAVVLIEAAGLLEHFQAHSKKGLAASAAEEAYAAFFDARVDYGHDAGDLAEDAGAAAVASATATG